jgi:hypothetical protein
LTSHARYSRVRLASGPSPSPYRRRSVPLARWPRGFARALAAGARWTGSLWRWGKARFHQLVLGAAKERGKKQDGHLPSAWPGPAAASSLHSIAPLSSGRPPPSRLLTDLVLPSRRPPSSPSGPSAACWLGAISCHPSPVEAQTLQQSTNLLPASSCKSLPPRRQLHSWARTASKLAGAVSRAKKEHGTWYLYVQTCRRADVRFGVELGVQRRAWVWTRVRGVCQRGVGGSA